MAEMHGSPFLKGKARHPPVSSAGVLGSQWALRTVSCPGKSPAGSTTSDPRCRALTLEASTCQHAASSTILHQRCVQSVWTHFWLTEQCWIATFVCRSGSVSSEELCLDGLY